MNFLNKLTVNSTEAMAAYTLKMEDIPNLGRKDESGYAYVNIEVVFSSSQDKNSTYFCQVVNTNITLNEKKAVIFVLTCMFVRDIRREPEIFEIALLPEDGIDTIHTLLMNFSIGRSFVIRRPTRFQDGSGGYYITLF